MLFAGCLPCLNNSSRRSISLLGECAARSRYGATPISVLARQQELCHRMESNPDKWFRKDYSELWHEATSDLCKSNVLEDVAEEDVVFVKNATAGVNAVINTLTLSAGDACLITSQTYGACANAVASACSKAGAELIVLQVSRDGLANEDVLCALLEQTFADHGGKIKFALLDHITSPTAVILPVRRLCKICKDAGAYVMVDGAHAPGNIVPLNIPSIGCDWYAGNLHKWLWCPKGCAFLWVSRSRQAAAQGVVISHEYKSAFQERFKMQGTLDDTAFLSVPAALAFAEQVGGGVASIAAENKALVSWAAEMLVKRWGTELLVPLERCCSMAVIRCPFEATVKTAVESRAAAANGGEEEAGDAAAVAAGAGAKENLFKLVWEQYNIVVPTIPMPSADGVWCRISAQLYNTKEDYLKLADAILQLKAERQGSGELERP